MASQADTTDRRIKIADLKKAGVAPSFPTLWGHTCWGAFIVGALCLFVVMCRMGEASPSEQLWQAMRGTTFAVLLTAYLIAGVNTFLAANGFGKRKKELLRWVASHVEWLSADHARTGSPFEGSRFEDAMWIGRPPKQRANDVTETGGLVVTAHARYQPRPFYSATGTAPRSYTLSDYETRITAEVTSVRTRAAAIAAAHATLFGAAFQIFSKLVRP